MEDSNLKVTTQKLMEAFIKLKRYHFRGHQVGDLKHTEIFILFCIKKCNGSDEEGLKISEISSHMRVSNPTTTQAINKLEERGYVKRSIDKEDRRAVRIVLTQKGEEAIIDANKNFTGFFDGLVSRLGQERSCQLTEIINEVIEYMNDNNNKRS